MSDTYYYGESSRKATQKYRKEKSIQITLVYKKEDYERDIEPFVNKYGASKATFIKQAVKEKCERERSNG